VRRFIQDQFRLQAVRYSGARRDGRYQPVPIVSQIYHRYAALTFSEYTVLPEISSENS
jgi:hypothetical protein